MSTQPTNGLMARADVDPARAQENLATLFAHVAGRYACGSTSVSAAEAYDLLSSIAFVLGLDDLGSSDALALLARDDLMDEFRRRRAALDRRAAHVTGLVDRINLTMPPIPSVSLRSTLLSLRAFPARCDTTFAAHEVPCDIDYQLAAPISEDLQGVDYVAAWLTQLQREANALAEVGLAECVRRLEARLPGYEDLNVNLHDLVLYGR